LISRNSDNLVVERDERWQLDRAGSKRICQGLWEDRMQAMKECLSEEILQQYFDGELASGRMESVALHLAGCEACNSMLRELEGETNLLMSALAPEFDVVVPTERLHNRIQAAIADVEPVHVSPAAARR